MLHEDSDDIRHKISPSDNHPHSNSTLKGAPHLLGFLHDARPYLTLLYALINSSHMDCWTTDYSDDSALRALHFEQTFASAEGHGADLV